MTLTPYAVGHIEMLNINRRFEVVIVRNPKYTNMYNRWRSRMARDTGRWERHDFADYLFRYHTYTGQQP